MSIQKHGILKSKRWYLFYRLNYLMSCNMNNGIERINGDLKHVGLEGFKNCTLIKLLEIIITKLGVIQMRLLGQFIYLFIFLCTIRFHKLKKEYKALKVQSIYQDTLVFLRIRFYIKCRLKVFLALFVYMYFYLKATVKNFLP